MAKLYVGVVIHGCPQYVTPCLDSILNSEFDFPTRFVFLDNGSPNPSDVAQVLQSAKDTKPDDVFTHVSATNLGCAAGWNFCIRKAYEDPEFEWIVLAGHDVVVHPRSLSNLVHRYQRGGVDITSGVDAVYDAPMPEPCEQEVIGANFSLIMLPKATLDVVGLFDENFWPAYFEDNDYHFRAILAGKGYGVWTWQAPFRHSRSATVRTYPELSAKFGANAEYFRTKWGGMPADVLEKNQALKTASAEIEQRAKLEAGEGWKS